MPLPDRCDGCGAPLDFGGTVYAHNVYGYHSNYFCHVSCLEDWQEAGQPGQRRNFSEVPRRENDPPAEPTGLMASIQRAWTRMWSMD